MTSQPTATATAAAPSPPPVPSDWAHYTHARLGVRFAYPKTTFRVSETATSVTLASALARDELGGDPHPKKWIYGLRIFARDLDVMATMKKEAESFYDMAFPKGVFNEQNGSIVKTRLLGLDGYRLTSGVEGYNSDEIFLARGPKATLVIRFDTVGDIMGPTPTEDEQRRVFAILEGSMALVSR